MEHAGASLDGPGHGIGVEEVGLVDHQCGGGGAGKGEKVGGVGAGEDGGVDGGVPVVQQRPDHPRADEAVSSGDADLFRFVDIVRLLGCH